MHTPAGAQDDACRARPSTHGAPESEQRGVPNSRRAAGSSSSSLIQRELPVNTYSSAYLSRAQKIQGRTPMNSKASKT